ncbi:MAG: YdcF family protein [Roseburia sp.]|nr:YdcF family protein [Roseburia sp.]
MARKKEYLVPLEKTKRAIYLYNCKPEKKCYFGIITTGVLGALCLLYCLAIGLFMGYGTSFFLIWGVMAAGFGIISFLLSRPGLLRRLPRWLRWSFRIFGIIGLVLFVGTEGVILKDFGKQGQPSADYVIVLGAQWKESGPSYVLKKRLDAAVDYLKKNPDAKVIVSGGKGGNEPIPEAEGMYGYLVGAGINQERILQENTSHNTYENLRNSGMLLDRRSDKVLVVTNNFHIFRSLGIAKKMGYEHVDGLAAGSYPAMLPNNLLREFFGVWKDILAGNM